MKKVTKILLPVDLSASSANAFRYAVQLADHIDASLEILHVVFPEVEAMDYPVAVANTTQSRLETARERLKKFIDIGLTALGQSLKNVPSISFDLEIGTPIHTICSTANRNSINLIILGSRGENRSGIEKLIGSVAAGVVSKSECPVMVIPDGAQFKDIERMTYATAIRDSDPFEIWHIQEMLKPFTPVVELVHVNFKKDGNSKASEKMKKMKIFFEERTPPIKINFHNIPGKNLQVELNKFIDTHNIDLLAMYQPPHNFWNRLFFKSDTKGMTLHTKVPLFIQKSK